MNHQHFVIGKGLEIAKNKGYRPTLTKLRKGLKWLPNGIQIRQFTTDLNLIEMRTIAIQNTTGLILVTLTLIACHAPADISGKLEGTENNVTKIYLIQPETLREVAASYYAKVIDSVLLNPDGSFAFHNLPKAKDPVLLEIAVQPSGKAPN